MLKRWAAWLPGIRWTIGGIAALVAGLAIVWALFVPIADLLAHHDVGSVKGSLHETAEDNARGRLLTLGAGLLAVGALAFTARNYLLSREGQVTDRYTKAIEQLGSDKLDVRIGGIYALERVARDSARDHPTVMEVLTAFIREHSHEKWPLPDHLPSQRPGRSARPDVQAALTVVGRRDPHRDLQVINLRGADLTGADLIHANLTGAHFIWANLAGAKLRFADLTGALLYFADLTGSNLTGTNLANANLANANLTSADLGLAKLTSADLTGANLSGADLRFTKLTGADLTDVNLDKARWPENAPVPEGWIRDPNPGWLRKGWVRSGSAEAD